MLAIELRGMSFKIPDYIWDVLLGVESLFCLFLIIFGTVICYKFPDHIFKKVPMTCLYISYFFAISASLAWAYLFEFSVTYTKVNRGIYLLAEFSKISMQQSQICVITEFCFQIRLLTEGEFFLDRSVT